MNKWYDFKPDGALPPERKYVLVRVKNLERGMPDPICVGYMKYHAGIRSAPFFVTPGCTINSPLGDERAVQWCDCLPEDFEWYPVDTAE